MMWIAGADGRKGGWVVVLRDLATGRIEIRLVEFLSSVLDGNEPPAVLCVDVPIGLLDAAVPGGARMRPGRSQIAGGAACALRILAARACCSGRVDVLGSSSAKPRPFCPRHRHQPPVLRNSAEDQRSR